MLWASWGQPRALGLENQDAILLRAGCVPSFPKRPHLSSVPAPGDPPSRACWFCSCLRSLSSPQSPVSTPPPTWPAPWAQRPLSALAGPVGGCIRAQATSLFYVFPELLLDAVMVGG